MEDKPATGHRRRPNLFTNQGSEPGAVATRKVCDDPGFSVSSQGASRTATASALGADSCRGCHVRFGNSRVPIASNGRVTTEGHADVSALLSNRTRASLLGCVCAELEAYSCAGEAGMTNLWQDLRYAIRLVATSPGFALIAVLTLALGIGANTAIFSVLDSVLLRALPVSHPEQLVVLSDPDSHGSSFGSEGGDRSLLAYSEFDYFRDHNEVFSDIFAADSQLPELEIAIPNSSSRAGVQRESAHVRLVSADYFATPAVTPAAGTFFTREVDRARGSSPIAVLSYTFWRQRFGLDPLALGKTIQIHQTSFQIVGVAPPGFFGETVGAYPDLWIPMMMHDSIYPAPHLLPPSNALPTCRICLP